MNEPGSATIVVIEDDANIAGLLDMYLRREGFRVLQADTGERGLQLVREHLPCLVILDLSLPGSVDGLEVCRRIRAEGALPVIMLTARDDEVDRVLGLEMGADDYVTKPFSPREVVARVRAVLRRARGAPHPARVLRAGRVEVDLARREARVDGHAVDLTAREFELLRLLAEHAGVVLTRRQILDGAWGPGWYGDERTVDVHVRQLRRKLGDALQLTTIRGVGYRLT